MPLPTRPQRYCDPASLVLMLVSTGGSKKEEDVNFCCLCVPGQINNAFPTPCGVNITQKYEAFLKGELECGDEEEICPYNVSSLSCPCIVCFT